MKKIILTISFLFLSTVLAMDDGSKKAEENITQDTIQTKESRFQKSKLNGIIPPDGTIGKAITNGDVKLSTVADLIFYWIDYFTYIIGGLAILNIIYGGYQYVIGSVSDEKERGKKSVTYALVGVFITFCSWMAINWIQEWVTS